MSDLKYSNPELISNLNEKQEEAVLCTEGPLLVLAGAGSGKTRVITYRIAHLIENLGVSPYRILALTFTNKAAREMKERVAELIDIDVESLWVGTFHSMILRLLRRHSDRLGFENNFIILDQADREKVLRDLLKELNIDESTLPIKTLSVSISNAKNKLQSVEEYRAKNNKSSFAAKDIAGVYELYQNKLKESSAMDFDDILYFGVQLLEENPDILKFYREKFQYILVDEYQDTNHAQYVLVELLARAHGNLCVVGDDDQSIYGFRGANVNNILDFEKSFDDCKTIKLEQNYRSTSNILNAANKVIANNKGRKPKTLWTAMGEGDLITFYRGGSHIDEAKYVASEIYRLVNISKTTSYGNIAVLYRMNALSRNIENALTSAGIPYAVYGGFSFYDRKEIKDLMAYMRLILAGDDFSFERVINVPKRGIGAVTQAAIAEAAQKSGLSQLEVIGKTDEIPELSKGKEKISAFYELITRLRKKLAEDDCSLAEYFEYVQNETGIIQEILEQQDRSGIGRESVGDKIEILKELISAVIEFEMVLADEANRRNAVKPQSLSAESDTEDTEDSEFRDKEKEIVTLRDKLEKYIETVSLSTDRESSPEETEFVNLMTIHSAKGLEFDYVFLVGADEGIFPGFQSINDVSDKAIEEERRLAYVAITRAGKKLYITTAIERMLFGQTRAYPTSRFVQEIPNEYINMISAPMRSGGRRSSYGGARRAGGGGTFFRGGVRGEGARAGGKRDKLSGKTEERQDSSISFDLFLSEYNQKNAESAPDSEENYLLPDEIKKGDIVVHGKFGTGKVINVVPVAHDAIAQIEFDEWGMKKLMTNHGKLKKFTTADG